MSVILKVVEYLLVKIFCQLTLASSIGNPALNQTWCIHVGKNAYLGREEIKQHLLDTNTGKQVS